MEVIATNIYRWRSKLSGPHQPVNSYLVNAGAGPVLIDPAADLTPDKLPQRPLAILITHVQKEHIAGVCNFPDVPLYVPMGDEYLCRGRAVYENGIEVWREPWDWESRGNFQGHVAGARNERPPASIVPVTGTIEAGSELCGLRAIATLGHGKGALTFIGQVAGRRVAFCGDLICDNGKLWNWFDAEWDYGLEHGQQALAASAASLLGTHPDLLLPAHGEPIAEPAGALQTLQQRLAAVLAPPVWSTAPINFPEKDAPMVGWRQLSPHLYQWRTGNCAVIVSQSGNALLIDDGLCYWEPLPIRAAHHRSIIAEMKQALGIKKIEICIPTHIHGDHIENLPTLVEDEDTQIVALDVVAEVMLYPERFNLAAMLWWYDAGNDVVPVHRSVPSGTKLSWHEYQLEIFHLGGQTYYHAGIDVQVDDLRVLFVGDAAWGVNEGPEATVCYNDAEPQTRGWLFAVNRMLGRQPDLLVCGHGSAILHPVPVLQRRQQNWLRRMEEYRALDARDNMRLFFDPFWGG